MPLAVRIGAVLLGMWWLLLAPTGALAHPLGNFTVNRSSRIEVSAGAIRVWSALDNAEIPSVQVVQVADTDRNGLVDEAEWGVYRFGRVEELRRGLELMIDGRPVPLTVRQSELEVSVGQADLPLVRIEAWFEADLALDGGEHRATFRDRNEPERIGWRELVVRADEGARLAGSTVPTSSPSGELRSYPEDSLQSPLDQRQATWSFTAPPATSAVPPLSPVVAPRAAARPSDPLAALVTAPALDPWTILLAVLTAAALGGIHAASPGHGKSIMAAYIVGTSGSPVHALVLALSVAVSHTAGVLALGAVTLLASSVILPEQLYPWLTLASGLVVLTIGLGLLVRAARGARADGHDHGHTHGHDHTHEHGPAHGHRHDLPPTWRNLVALGLAGGLVPSASALVVLLSALALGRLGFGLLLIVAFGAGMAVVLTATGLLIVHAGRLIARLAPEGGSPLHHAVGRAVPVLSALVMTLVGLVVLVQALGQVGLLTDRTINITRGADALPLEREPGAPPPTPLLHTGSSR